jgi:hypothetical protein
LKPEVIKAPEPEVETAPEPEVEKAPVKPDTIMPLHYKILTPILR